MNSELPRACESFAEELSHLVLGELDDARRAALESHLHDCAACRAERDLLARSVAVLQRDVGGVAPVLELSEARRADLMAQAAATATRSSASGARRPWLTLNRLAAAAAVVAGVAVAWNWTWRRMHREADEAEVRGSLAALRDERSNGPEPGEPLFMGADPSQLATEDATSAGFCPGVVGFDEPTVPQGMAELTEEQRLQLQALGYVENAPADHFALPTGLAVPPDPVALQEEMKWQEAEGAAEDRARVMTIQPNAPTDGAQGGAAALPTAGLPSGATGGTPLAKGGGGGGNGPTAFTSRRVGGGRSKGHDGRVSKNPPAPVTSGRSHGGTYVGPGDAVAPEPAPKPSATRSGDGGDLASLGYMGAGSDDDEESDSLEAGLANPDPAVRAAAAQTLATLLADSNAPTDVLLLQPQLRAAFGIDPNMPMDGGDGGRRTEDLVREFMKQLAPRQGETPRDMFFRYFGDHPFTWTRVDARSTFGMDVDTASYNLVRAYLAQGNLPPKAAVRTEEFVNAFRHDLAPPPTAHRDGKNDGAEVFAIHDELAPSPFGESGTLLLQIGLKAREIPKSARRPACLTFVVDVSGSMAEGGRLELVKRSLRMLVDQLDERDSIGLVVFSTDGRRVLDPTNATRRGVIFAALDGLSPEGSTNADAGLRLGYDMALEQRRPDAENRVILCSDGVANTGITNASWLVQRIRECKTKDLYLNCIGVGMNNHNDALLEQLADEGDGFCAYVDRDEEAKEIFVDRLSGTLTTVARNAKVQVEFDPSAVRRFRQLGYENRAIADQDFRNDRIDAGEVGAGHEVIALYELELQPGAVGPLATVRCRYEEPRSREVPHVIEQAREVFVAEAQPSIERATPRFRLSAAVAEFAEILRQSVHARASSLGAVVRLAEPLVAELPGDPDVPEFVALVQQAARLPDLLPRRTDLVRCVDEIKRARCWQEELRAMEAARRAGSDAAQDAANDDLMRQLEEQNRRLEDALREAIERAARGA
jgi:Ca-activated chloride channel family protein